MPMKVVVALALCLMAATPAVAQEYDNFSDGKDNAKVHTSGFVCPDILGHFERDAVGRADIETGADFCAYSALDGVYGTVTLVPLSGPYDAKSALAPEFTETEGTGGKIIGEKTITVAPKSASPLSVYTRTYQTAELETLHYRIEFTGATIGNWAVETTIEYADPRDTAVAQSFFDAIYADALKEITAK
jgi:hypothetical protein